jgi:hypothetical protein
MPPSPCTVSTRKPAVSSSICSERAFEIVELHIVEARQQRLEAVAHLGLVGCRDRPDRTAVKGVLEGDQLVALRVAADVVIAARGLDRALDRLDARIGEEHRVGEAVVDDALRQRLALRASHRGC